MGQNAKWAYLWGVGLGLEGTVPLCSALLDYLLIHFFTINVRYFLKNKASPPLNFKNERAGGKKSLEKFHHFLAFCIPQSI